MKKLLLITLVTVFSFASDFAISHEQLNDKFILPEINEDMSLEEFELLSYSPGVKDIGYAIIVPGYVHFRAHDQLIGYINLGLSLTGYATMIAISNSEDGFDTETNRIIYDTALATVIGVFLFDWIHGLYELESKQTSIRYKYAKKLHLSVLPKKDGAVVGVNVAF